MSVDICFCTNARRQEAYPVRDLGVAVFRCEDCGKIGVVEVDYSRVRYGYIRWYGYCDARTVREEDS